MFTTSPKSPDSSIKILNSSIIINLQNKKNGGEYTPRLRWPQSMMPKPKLSVVATDTQVVSPCIYIICEIIDFVNIFIKTAVSISRHRLFSYLLLFQNCKKQFDKIDKLFKEYDYPILLRGVFIRNFVGAFNRCFVGRLGLNRLLDDTDVFRIS